MKRSVIIRHNHIQLGRSGTSAVAGNGQSQFGELICHIGHIQQWAEDESYKLVTLLGGRITHWSCLFYGDVVKVRKECYLCKVKNGPYSSSVYFSTIMLYHKRKLHMVHKLLIDVPWHYRSGICCIYGWTIGDNGLELAINNGSSPFDVNIDDRETSGTTCIAIQTRSALETGFLWEVNNKQIQWLSCWFFVLQPGRGKWALGTLLLIF